MRSSTAAMRKEARGRAARKARKARNDQARQGPTRLRSVACPSSQRACFREVGESCLHVLKNSGKGRSSPALLHRRAMSALSQRRPGRRISIATSRCRQRQRRSEVKSVIEALILGGLERTLHFEASCAERQIPGSARLLAAQTAGLASRENPPEFLKRTNAADLARLRPLQSAEASLASASLCLRLPILAISSTSQPTPTHD